MRQRQRFMRIAKHERAAMHRQRRMRKELEKIVTFVVKRALTVCMVCNGSLPLMRGYGKQGASHSLCICSKKCLARRMKALRPRGNRGHHRRARKNGLPARKGKSVGLVAVGERDGWLCQLCGQEIESRKGSISDPMSPCIDHIVPLNFPGNTAHGHVESNVQIAHRKCNGAKGCSIACLSLLDCMDPREHLRRMGIDQSVAINVDRLGSDKNGPFGGKPHATSTRVSVG